MPQLEVPITKNGLLQVQEELDQLIKVEREALKKIISDARDLGDLKENAEYHSAKEKQALMEGRIMQLQGIIANSRVIDISTISSDSIVFGATVSLNNTENDTTLIYQIVGPSEANTRDGKISYDSPLGRALIGKEDGDAIVVKAPKGDLEYEILSFEFK